MADHRSREVSSKVDPKGCVHFTYQELSQATNNFDDRPLSRGGCKLGEGGYGPVFKCSLKYTEVAVKGINKRMRSNMADFIDKQFLTEVEVLSKFRHPNLVTLLGCSMDGEVPYLVYEYLPNGTLEDAIEYKYEKGVGMRLSWQMRLSIALDTARGLNFLHTADQGRPLVHRDVKSANVLLDHAYRAKVGDFGLARVVGGSVGGQFPPYHREGFRSREVATTVNIVGTSGYIPKEYLEGIITPKMDVYAYGVILLEMITGLASYDSRRTVRDLTSYLKKELIDISKDGKGILTRVDPEAGSWPSNSIVKLAKVANDCLEEKMDDRPTMGEVYNDIDRILIESAQTAAEDEKFKNPKRTKQHKLINTGN